MLNILQQLERAGTERQKLTLHQLRQASGLTTTPTARPMTGRYISKRQSVLFMTVLLREISRECIVKEQARPGVGIDFITLKIQV